MTVFSQKLTDYIVKSRKTLVALAQDSDFEFSYLSKIRKGLRIPNDREKVRKLIDALCLTPAESEDLLQAYDFSVVGEETYRTCQAVKYFLEEFGSFSDFAIQSNFCHALPDHDVLYGYSAVNGVLRAVIEQEAVNPNGLIRLIIQPEYSFLMNLLASLNITIPIEHLVCLEAGMGKFPGWENITRIRQIVPVLISGRLYQPCFYYDHIASHLNNMTLMPYLVLTSKYAIRLSYSFDCSELTADVQTIQLYHSQFERLRNQCKPLTQMLPSSIQMLEYVIQMEKNRKRTICNFSHEPCLVNFISDACSRNILFDTVPNRDYLTKQFIERNHALLRLKTPTVSYFTRDGLYGFLHSGRLMDFSPGYCRPLPVQERLETLIRFYEAAKRGDFIPLLLKDQKFQISKDLDVGYYEDKRPYFFYRSGNENSSYFFLEEKTASDGIVLFLELLRNSDYVESLSESMAFIEKTIQVFP